jgi:PEGA domain
MKLPRLFPAVAALVGAALFPALVPSFAQSTVTVEHEVAAPVTTTETRTYVKDGKTVTEKVTITTAKEKEAVSKTYKTAIFVTNHAGAEGDSKLQALEDYVTARVTDLGVSTISRETASDAVAKMSPGATANALDTALAQNSSALSLAQALGADYLLQITLTGFDVQVRPIDAYGVKAINETRTLRVTYKILDGQTGASLASDTVKVSSLIQQTPNAVQVGTDHFDELLDQASVKVATSLKSRIDSGRITAPSAVSLVTVTLNTEAADLTVPDIRIGVENTVSISESKFKVSALAATVEVNGVAVGTAPGQLSVRPGLGKLRITRAGFKPYERTVNFVAGQSLTVALQLSDEGYARWKDSTAFLNDLKNGAKLTDAEAKVLEGKAKMLEQSGFKVDTKDAPAVTIVNEAGGHAVGTGKNAGENPARSLFTY